MANAGEKRKLAIEPITAVCAVILLVACVAVVAVDVHAKYFEDYSDPVGYGDSVTLEYTGSLYDYYNSNSDTKKAVIFDTTQKSVGTNKDYSFVNGFNSSKSYGSYNAVLGQTSLLEGFTNAVIGKNVGDTVRVKIAADQAYVGTDINTFATEFGFSKTVTMSHSEFTSFYGETITQKGYPLTFTDKKNFTEDSGPMVNAIRSGDMVTVTYLVSDDDEFDVSNKLGNVHVKITDASGDVVKFSMTLSETYSTGKTVCGVPEVETFTFEAFPTVHMNIVGANGTTIAYNEAGLPAEKQTNPLIQNQDLYFVIKIVSRN